MDMEYILLGSLLLVIIVLSNRNSIKKIWFKIPFFAGGLETRDHIGTGGRGGSATALGQNSVAVGGPGGGGGVGGKGGDGGGAHTTGDNSFAAGGEGGESGQVNRGGRGGRSGYEAAGLPNFQLPDGTWIYDYGRGGDGAHPKTPSPNNADQNEV